MSHTTPSSLRAPWRSFLAVLTALAAVAVGAAPTLPSPAQPVDRLRPAAQEVGFFREATPARARLDRDRRPVELGARFRSSVPGVVTGAQVLKLGKGAAKTPRRASLWSARGKRLATATFEPTAAVGWISVRFPRPVSIVPKRKYTVSVFAPRGRYAVTERALDKRRTRGDLQLLGNRNGVYRYGKSSAFPERSHRGSNYWVDVTFRSSGSGGGKPKPKPASFPDETNTGVPAGTQLRAYTGPTTITRDGTVIDARTVEGGLSIQASNVVIKRSQINGPVSVSESGSLVVSDTFIDVGDQPGTGLEAYNYTAERVHIVGGNRSAYCAWNCTIRDSYVHGQFTDETGEYHESGIRMEQNTTLIHNSIACDAPLVPPDAGCSAGLTGYGDFQPVRDNLIQGNLFLPSTGSACAYGGSSEGKPHSDGAQNIRFVDNVFVRGHNNKCGVYFPVIDFDRTAPGNVWQGNVWNSGGAVRP